MARPGSDEEGAVSLATLRTESSNLVLSANAAGLSFDDLSGFTRRMVEAVAYAGEKR